MGVLLLSGSAYAQLKHGDSVVTVVNTPEVNIRTEPRVASGTFLMKVPLGTQMKRLGARNGWYHVVAPDGREAWINVRYAEEGVARDLLEVRPSQVNVREQPTTGSGKIETVKRGDMLHLDRERDGWYLAILPDGRRGWIREDMVVHRPLSPPAPEASPPPEVKPEPEPEPEPEVREVEPEEDFFQQALDFVSGKKYKEAAEAFRKALKERPGDASIHFELAKALQAAGEPDEALKHFRRALQGAQPRPEAKFYIEGILRAREDTVVSGKEEPLAAELPADPVWWETLLEGYLLHGIAIGSLVFLVVMGVLYRRRRAGRVDRPAYRRRKPDAGFESVLKYAVEKRPLLRSIEEAERKRAEMDLALQQRFENLGAEGASGGPKLPGVESTEALLKRVEDLRQTILGQEERAQIYSDLVVLQNEKIEALDEEIDALKKLIQIDYRDSGEKPKGASGQKTGKDAGTT